MHLLFQRASLEILQNNKVAIATRTMAKTLWYNPLHYQRDISFQIQTTVCSLLKQWKLWAPAATVSRRAAHRETVTDKERSHSSSILHLEIQLETKQAPLQNPTERDFLPPSNYLLIEVILLLLLRLSTANKQAIPTKLVADLLQSLCLLTQVQTIQALVFLREEEENTRAMEKVYRKNEAPGHDKD